MSKPAKVVEHESDCDSALELYQAQKDPQKIILKALAFYREFGLEAMVKPEADYEPGPGPLRPSPGGVRVTACPYEEESGECSVPEFKCISPKATCSCRGKLKKKKKKP